VLKLLHISGDDVPVLQPIAVIGAAGEDWQAALGASGEQGTGNREQGIGNREWGTGNGEQEVVSESAPKAMAVAAPQSPVPSPQSLSPHLPISPRARNLAEKEKVSVTFLGTGPGGRVIERDVLAALENRPPLTAAAKAAVSGAVPEAGTGIGGRITAADLASSPVPSPQSTFSTEGAITETPIKGIRKIISDRMLNSLTESAQFTLNASASAVKLQEIRSKIKSAGNFANEHGLAKVTINDLILFAVSRMLPRFPFMNAHKIGDTIRTFERVHLAVAVDTPRGLMVPVIRNANLLSLTQISAEAKRLAAACQNGSAKTDELSGSTFTVTNLGSFGITSFTPVLNSPEIAILGVCGIEMKPVAQSMTGQAAPNPQSPTPSPQPPIPVIFEPHIGFSLTINHQVVDGAPAAKFLKEFVDAVTNIDLLLAAG